MKKSCCKRYIYCITNLINGRNYIGQRTFEGDPENDIYFGSGKLLKWAINKYGKENFKKKILEIGFWEKSELDAKEKYWIKFYKDNFNADYNVSLGGTGGNILENSPELQKLSVEKRKQTFSLKSEDELNAMYKHHGEAMRTKWKNYSMEEREIISKNKSESQKNKYATDVDYYNMRVEINRKNAQKQSETQRSEEWINSVGKDSHRRQNIHVAKTFFLDTRTGKLYTRKAVALMLHIPLTLNIGKELKNKYPFIQWIENTEENDIVYNFIDNVIVACYKTK